MSNTWKSMVVDLIISVLLVGCGNVNGTNDHVETEAQSTAGNETDEAETDIYANTISAETKAHA